MAEYLAVAACRCTKKGQDRHNSDRVSTDPGWRSCLSSNNRHKTAVAVLVESWDPAGADASGADAESADAAGAGAATVGAVAERPVRDAALPRCYESGERRHSAACFADTAVAEGELEERGTIAAKATADVECRAADVVVAEKG